MSDGREVHISYVEGSFEGMRWGWAWRRPWEGQREGCCGRAKSMGGSLTHSLTGRRDWGPPACSTPAMETEDPAMGLSRSRPGSGIDLLLPHLSRPDSSLQGQKEWPCLSGSPVFHVLLTPGGGGRNLGGHGRDLCFFLASFEAANL